MIGDRSVIMSLLPILEDNVERIAAMRAVLSRRFPQLESIISDNPPTLIAVLEARWAEVVAISLDHDLFDRSDGSTEITGMDVVRFLVQKEPSFPVVIHSSNHIDAEKMQKQLRRKGWHVTRVIPFDDTEWIAAEWAAILHNF